MDKPRKSLSVLLVKYLNGIQLHLAAEDQDASKSSPTGVRFKANSSFPLVAAAIAISSSSNALKFL